jgi:hypothetical protein
MTIGAYGAMLPLLLLMAVTAWPASALQQTPISRSGPLQF